MPRQIGYSCFAFVALLSLGCESKPESKSVAESDEPTGQSPAPQPSQERPVETEETKVQQTATAPLAEPGARAELGKPAPVFTLAGVDGKEHGLAELRGKTVVLEWFNPDCPFVKFAHKKGPLASQAKQTVTDDIVWLSINSGGEGKQGHGLQRNQQALTEYAMDNPVLLDPSGAVGKAYGAEKTPHMFVVDPKGVLVYRGGIDNAPIGRIDNERPRYPDSPTDTVVNYIRGALQDIGASRPLRLPDTPAYGCSVKYSS